MTQFYKPPLDSGKEDPFVRDGEDKLIRRSYWLDLTDRSIVLIMTQGIGTRLTADEKRAHLIDIRRPHLDRHHPGTGSPAAGQAALIAYLQPVDASTYAGARSKGR